MFQRFISNADSPHCDASVWQLRGYSYQDACNSLATKVDPAKFEAAFGAPLDQLQGLVDTKTVTIARLLEVCPAGTLDPTPSLYDNSMYAICGCLSLAAIGNAMIRPVDPKYFMVPPEAFKAAADLGAVPPLQTER